jgi:DNA-binding CsgD family transcriptional regulator
VSPALDALVERAYAFDGDSAGWLSAIVRAAAAALERGVVGILVERRSDGDLASAHVALEGVAEEWRETLRRTAVRMQSAELERRFRTSVTHERGVLAVSARADERTAVLLDAPLDGGGAPPLDAWRRAAEHLASALHLRAQLAAADVGDAASVWHGLLEGRFAVADRFDRDGRRFVVVRTTDAGDRSALTTREREVLASIACGHANKRIALELGVSESTVSAALRGAARKLGVRSRVELARILGPARKA